MEHPEFVVRDLVLSIPAWEWNSTEESICGHRLRYSILGHHSTSDLGDYATQFYLHFENHWSVELWFTHDAEPTTSFDADTVRYASFVADSRIASLDQQYTHLRDPIGPEALLPSIIEVAERERWDLPRSRIRVGYPRPARMQVWSA